MVMKMKFFILTCLGLMASAFTLQSCLDDDDDACYVICPVEHPNALVTVKPTADGLYVIVKKRGTGAKVATGMEVAINYTGRLLDGTIFDSSVESDARSGEIYDANRPYKPLTYVVGKMGLIPGWEQGIMGQPQGTILQLVIPSALAYGSHGAGSKILPFSPLVFDIEIVSVNKPKEENK